MDIMELFYSKYREHLLKIKLQIPDSQYLVCRNLAADLIRHSLFFDYDEGLFIAEYLEYLFFNTYQIFDDFKVEPDDKKEIDSSLNNIIDFLVKVFPINEEENKLELLSIMTKVRVNITRFQINYLRDKPSLRKESPMREMIFEPRT